MSAPHAFVDEEQRLGCQQAEAFLARVESGEPIECDDLAQQLSLARFGSCERQRAFAGRIQQAMVEGVRGAS